MKLLCVLFGLKAFHSKHYKYIVQEAWARAVLYNFCSEISMHVEIPEKNRKHTCQINDSEAEFLAKALGHDMTYFLVNYVEEYRKIEDNKQLAFFAGTLEEGDKKIADKLVEMFRFYDALTTIGM